MSQLKVNALVSYSGNTVTLGTSGDTINVASGVTFNTSSNIVLPAGAVGTPSLTTSGDLNTGIFFPAADTIAFTEGGTEVMRIDSSGNVGIGTTSASSTLDVRTASGEATITVAGGTSRGNVLFKTGASDGLVSAGTIGFDAGASTSGSAEARVALISSTTEGATANNRGGRINFFTKSDAVQGLTERMRIDSSGKLFLNTTTVRNNGMQSIDYDGNTVGGMGINDTASANASPFIGFLTGGTFRGSITNNNNTAVAYNTTSDHRLKENVNYNFDATTRLKQLKPARFNFIGHSNRIVDGFLAHEVSDIVPEAITGTKDETKTKEKVVVNTNGQVIAENIEQADWEAGKITDENGNSRYPIDSTWEASKVVPVYQGIDQAKLTPILTKALQEAIAKIEQLEARLTALES